MNKLKTQGLSNNLYSADYIVIILCVGLSEMWPGGFKLQKTITYILVMFDMLILPNWINYKCYFKGLNFLS